MYILAIHLYWIYLYWNIYAERLDLTKCIATVVIIHLRKMLNLWSRKLLVGINKSYGEKLVY